METRVEFITPEIAKCYLGGNENNRRVSAATLSQYCENIRNGAWKLNGESIKFDTDGKLIDGQHRLYAVVKTGIGISTLVTRGLDREVFDTIDTGKKRTAGDCLSIKGVLSCSDAAAIIRIYLKMKTTEVASFLSAKTGSRNAIRSVISGVTNMQVLDEYNSHPEEYDEITRTAKRYYKSLRLLPISLMGAYMAFLTIHLGKDKEKVFDFFAQCTTGDNIRSNAMAYLHKLLIKRVSKSIYVSPAELDKYIKKAWNMQEAGRDALKVTIKKDEKYSFE